MMKQSSNRQWMIKAFQKRWMQLALAIFSISTAVVFITKTAFDSCSSSTPVATYAAVSNDVNGVGDFRSPLEFMRSKLVVLVSHELSLSGGPLLLMELAFLLRAVGTDVVWLTIQKPTEVDDVIYNLEHRMVDRGVQIQPAKDQKAIDTSLKADLVVLNTAVAGKWLWLDIFKDDVQRLLPKVLWWIHEMRGHYFKVEYVKHLPFVAGAMIDSHVTAEYWKNRTRERLGIKMPKTYVVHLGNSKELMAVAEDDTAKKVLREHIRESLGVRNNDLLFGIINSVSRGKGQDLFLRGFYESLKIIEEKKLKVSAMHALVVGSDMSAQTKFETELRNFVAEKKLHDRVHFINKTLMLRLDAGKSRGKKIIEESLMKKKIISFIKLSLKIFFPLNFLTSKQSLNVSPYLAAIDVLVQNSQARGECFGRITIEAMAFQLPVLGTSAGGTTEIVVDGTTGYLHPPGKEGVTPLAKNIVKLATSSQTRQILGRNGYKRVKQLFLEHHMSKRIAAVLQDVLQKSQSHAAANP